MLGVIPIICEISESRPIVGERASVGVGPGKREAADVPVKSPLIVLPLSLAPDRHEQLEGVVVPDEHRRKVQGRLGRILAGGDQGLRRRRMNGYALDIL